MDYATAKYLIYTCFDTKRSPTESTIAGSLLLDGAKTIQEAEEKVELYRSRGVEYDAQYAQYDTAYHKSSRYIYIENKAEWWGAPGFRETIVPRGE
jgi:hypothetical protein